jgi:hypothetical protein
VHVVGDQPVALGAAGVAAVAVVSVMQDAALLLGGVPDPAAEVERPPVGVGEEDPH